MIDEEKEVGPAFPPPLSFNPNGEACFPGNYEANVCGMSLRDYFAIHATDADIGMEYDGWMRRTGFGGAGNIPTRAEMRYSYADTMIAARRKP